MLKQPREPFALCPSSEKTLAYCSPGND
jgi:hypothetical protein